MSQNNTLVNLSKQIRETADHLLGELGLFELLSPFGEVRFTGSYAANVMYNLDIDIYLIKPNPFSIEEVLEIHNAIFRRKLISGNLLLGNNRDFTNPEYTFPEGYYLGLKTRVKSLDNSVENCSKWKIDIWCIDSSELDKIYFVDLCDKITNELRPIILQIKQYVSDNGLEVPSIAIYDAVFNQGCSNLSDFKKLINAGHTS